MRKIISVLSILLLIILSFNCDGRDRSKTYSKIAITSQGDSVRYYPAKYSEKTTDTILSNNYRVIIKSQTDFDGYTEVYEKLDNKSDKKIKTRYYNFINNVKIYDNEKLIFIKTIENDYFIEKNLLTKEQTENLVFKSFNIIQNPSVNNNNLMFEVIYTNPLDESKSVVFHITYNTAKRYLRTEIKP